jgi:hypothetical protein
MLLLLSKYYRSSSISTKVKPSRDMTFGVHFKLYTIIMTMEDEDESEEATTKTRSISSHSSCSAREDKFAYDLHSDLIYSTAETIKLERTFFSCIFSYLVAYTIFLCCLLTHLPSL